MGIRKSRKMIRCPWWNNHFLCGRLVQIREIQINQNHNDVTKQQISPKVYKKHATHLLVEFQMKLTVFSPGSCLWVPLMCTTTNHGYLKALNWLVLILINGHVHFD
jgi:hypothetical protein